MMRLDPSEEDSDDSGNERESPVGETQIVDMEVCSNDAMRQPLFLLPLSIFPAVHRENRLHHDSFLVC